MFKSILAIMLVGSLALGCGGSGDTTTPLKVTAMVANVSGLNTTAIAVTVTESGSAVTDAAVTVAGQTVPHSSGGDYVLAYSPAIAEGATVSLSVTRNGVTVSGSVIMPEEPTVTQPVPLSVYDSTLPITVAWNAMSFTPDNVEVGVDGAYTVSGTTWTATVPGTATTVDIPAFTLSPGQTDVYVPVIPTNKTQSLGSNAEAGSELTAAFTGVGGPFSTAP